MLCKTDHVEIEVVELNIGITVLFDLDLPAYCAVGQRTRPCVQEAGRHQPRRIQQLSWPGDCWAEWARRALSASSLL